MKIYVITLDQQALQAALDQACGPGVFTTGRDKLPDGTRRVHYICDDATPATTQAQAAEVAAAQDNQYLQKTKAKFLDAINRASVKCCERQLYCVYTEKNRDDAQAWLDRPETPCPIIVQVRAASKEITNTTAAQQIVDIYNRYSTYQDQVAEILIATQTALLATTTVIDTKLTYQNGVDQFAVLENTDYS